MNSKEERKLRKLFATKIGSPIYKIYYNGRTFRLKEDKEILLTKHQVLELLDIDFYGYSESERSFITGLWNRAISRFQKRAWDIGQPWGTIKTSHLETGTTIWLHGYTMDPSKQESMKNFKHSQSVSNYIAEQKQELAFAEFNNTERE
jgi:hypothetical protein